MPIKENRPDKRIKIPSERTREILAIAVTLTILLVVGYFWKNRTIVTSAPLAQTLTIPLPDDSEVVLNDGSSIKYERSTWGEERTIKLLGEAYFRVQKGKTFQVHTTNGTITVLGTHFTIRSWGDKLYVECYEGRVVVSSNRQEINLTANQSVNVVQGDMKEKQPITHQQPLWSTGNSKFHEENINQVFAELERQYNVQVNAPRMNRTFSGSFQHDNMERALKSICLPMQLEYSNNNGQYIIITN